MIRKHRQSYRRLGVSLPPGYLCGQTDSPNEAALAAAYGRPEECLRDLQSHRVAAIELRSIPAAAEVGPALEAARRVLDFGFDLTVHGSLPKKIEGKRFAEVFPALDRIVRLVQARRRDLVVTVHGFSKPTGDAAALRDRLAQTVKEVMSLVDAERLHIRLALELKRDKGQVDPCSSYEDLSALVRQICHPGVGICWDMGHAYANVLHRGVALEPPAAFVRQVIHTHIHGLGPDDRSHCPLTVGGLPLSAFAGALEQAGYGGVFNLELNAARVAELGDLPELMRESISVLGSSPFVFS